MRKEFETLEQEGRKNTESTTFGFASANIELKSEQENVHNLCKSYFETYAQINSELRTKPDWTIVDETSNDVIENTWQVDGVNKNIYLTRKADSERFVMRIVRSLSILEDIDHGIGIFKGASFINRNGKGVVLLGEKRAGKTSLALTYMLQNLDGARFITNSHVGFGLKDGIIHSYGYPMAVGVRLNVLEAIQRRGGKNLGRLLSDIKSNLSVGEENRYYLEPDFLRTHFQNNIAPCAPVDAIVILRSIPSRTQSHIEHADYASLENFFREYHIRHQNLKNSGWYSLFETDRNKAFDISTLAGSNLYRMTYNVDNHKVAIDMLDKI